MKIAVIGSVDLHIVMTRHRERENAAVDFFLVRVRRHVANGQKILPRALGAGPSLAAGPRAAVEQ